MYFTQENAVDLHSVVQSLNNSDDGWGKTCRSCQKHDCVTAWSSFSWSPFARYFVRSKLEVKFCTAITA